ncbi:tetratricopeptide repeat protein [Catenulispora sp. EB89]|uniref:tetratricopeptide repeat protein n=1 Tax=Catenulispora sp. EB89 TaxID=3156257 RepID=UPI0035118520
MEAAFTLGMRYDAWSHNHNPIHLHSVEWLEERARLYLRLAADAGHARAAVQLAFVLARARSEPYARDEDQFWSDEELRYLTAAAESGHVHAAFIVGAVGLRYSGQLPDTSAAERYLRQAVDGDHPKAAFKLGEWLLRQAGRQSEALRYLKLAGERADEDVDPQDYIDLARILTRTQRSDIAEPFVRAALASPRKYSGANYDREADWMELLGDVLNRTRRRAEAKEWYESARARRTAPKRPDDWPDYDAD